MGIFTETDNQSRTNELKLTMQIRGAIHDLVVVRPSVLGWVTMHHVADKGFILGAARESQNLVQQTSASFKERLLRLHALLAEALSNDHDR
ncbi:hypothetical protein GCM10027535_44640 [Mycolicibacterium hippocampi]|uniref:Uncharacterized protein n=1 Tax=Mycolicibacterium hippocampi TaxID=659824 RepID=A0A7I9ZPZ9_9MYCO|nr:hypothetical protein MHIP_32600 [Mycolicibacterium hippocampi]